MSHAKRIKGHRNTTTASCWQKRHKERYVQGSDLCLVAVGQAKPWGQPRGILDILDKGTQIAVVSRCLYNRQRGRLSRAQLAGFLPRCLNGHTGPQI